MKKSIFKRWWFWVIIVIVVIYAIGSSGGTDSTTTSSGNQAAQSVQASTPTPTPTEVVPDITITAKKLAADYKANEIRANQDYEGKLADITGVVNNIGETLGQTYVVLSSGEDFSFTDVQCFFSSASEIEKVANLNKGDKVTIRGVIKGLSFNVEVNKCVLR